jgi:hypothetical protein
MTKQIAGEDSESVPAKSGAACAHDLILLAIGACFEQGRTAVADHLLDALRELHRGLPDGGDDT